MQRSFFKTPKGTEIPLLNLKGKEYLEVKWRLVWFREEHPDWSIQTRMINGDDVFSIFFAEIKNATGAIMATAHKREDKGHFSDHMEKAETGAIGRALALCGYGSQFSPEIEEGERIVDAPVQFPVDERNPPAGVPSQPANKPAPRATVSAPPSQKKFKVPTTLEEAENFLMPFGKTKGFRLSGMTINDLGSALAWAESARKFEDFQAAAKIIINAANMPGKPSASFEDDLPF